MTLLHVTNLSDIWLGGRGSGLQPGSCHRKVTGVLGQDTELKAAPDVLVGTLHCSHHHQRVNVCMINCKLLRTKYLSRYSLSIAHCKYAFAAVDMAGNVMGHVQLEIICNVSALKYLKTTPPFVLHIVLLRSYIILNVTNNIQTREIHKFLQGNSAFHLVGSEEGSRRMRGML